MYLRNGRLQVFKKYFFLACRENLLLLDLLNKASSPAEIGEVTCTTHVGAEFTQKFFYLLLLLLKILSRVPLHCLDAVPLLKQYLVDFSTIVLRYIKSTDPRHFQMDPIVNHVILMRVMWLLSYQTNSFRAPFGSLCSTKIEAARLSPRRDFVETEAETVFPIYLCF